MDSTWLEREAQRSLDRLLPRIEPILSDVKAEVRAAFRRRLDAQFPRIFALLHRLYGTRYDFFYYLEMILQTTAQTVADREADLHALDTRREADPDWFLSETVVGGVCYVDLFAGDLAGVRDKIPYFQELGINYLHLMPLFRAPEPNSDGGYAVSDFRTVNPKLGTMADLRALTADLRAAGISLVLDFVFNHTADEHEWALKALAGDPEYQQYYFIFPDRTLPDRYEQHLREIFPDTSPGCFTYRPQIDSWVWTTFNSFQWDLNYANPETFNAMLGEMLYLANQGVEVLRLDAVAFIWKQMGTPCESLPQVHWIIQAYNALAQLAAPAMTFKSEAIIHPDLVASYIDRDECPLSYNPTFMALLWEALATREVKLLRHSMSLRWDIPDGCAWVNYVRVHDDIGWSFADEDAAEIGINGYDHRQFLNRFYTGQFPGSFATGVPFGFNPANQDMRISGTCASLAGLEQAIDLKNDTYHEHALRRILLIHGLILAAGGIPLIYIGDELATVNDFSYRQDPGKAADSRWVHRPKFDWNRAQRRTDPTTDEGRVFGGLRHMAAVRKATPALGGGKALFFDNHNPHVLSFLRNRQVLVLANFSEREQTIERTIVAAYWTVPPALVDLLTGEAVDFGDTLNLPPYGVMWLAAPQ